ncbi:MAG: hypothetical protein DVB29_05890 [Verrucomicrobia bacterium]|nr:MAG: hypothetical protein DVB29_05890 [Verrucomicrobiota bacterium]MDH4469708.1 hypothetical protein [Verrucomicrobiae bacterium]
MPHQSLRPPRHNRYEISGLGKLRAWAQHLSDILVSAGDQNDISNLETLFSIMIQLDRIIFPVPILPSS